MKNRIIREIRGKEEGYEIIVIAGMHGNEPAGVIAIENVINQIIENNIPIRGNLTAFRGNIEALKHNVRYIDRDLNRLWTNDFLSADNNNGIYEIKELKELNRCIKEKCSGNYKNCVLLDLHTFSSESRIFAIPADTPLSIDLARQFGVPFIEKLTTDLCETAVQYYASNGVTSVVFEGGRHDAADAVKNIEAAIFVALNYLNCINSYHIPELNVYKQRLRKDVSGIQLHYQLTYIHRIGPDKIFKMQPGYLNFQKIKNGEILAFENQKPIHSQYDGYILMPLYQKLGSNGFFIVEGFEGK